MPLPQKKKEKKSMSNYSVTHKNGKDIPAASWNKQVLGTSNILNMEKE